MRTRLSILSRQLFSKHNVTGNIKKINIVKRENHLKNITKNQKTIIEQNQYTNTKLKSINDNIMAIFIMSCASFIIGPIFRK